MSLSGYRSIADLPNLPGVRRSNLSSNPTLFKEYLRENLGASNHIKSDSFYDDKDALDQLSASIYAYPADAKSFNDTAGRYSLRSAQSDRKSGTRALPYSNINKAPSFVTNNDQMCNFTAYFVENVPENLDESQRVRVVDITVYVVDESMEVREPYIANSGLNQGKLVKKSRFLKPNSDQYYGLADFTAGSVVRLFKREYTILNCNDFTRGYLAGIDVDFGDAIPTPTSTDMRIRKREGAGGPPAELFSCPSRPFTSLSKNFYEKGKLVLRYYGTWDGQDEPIPTKYRVRVHYFLADDNIEIISEYRRNDGRDRVPKLLRKMRVLKPSPTDYGIMTSAQSNFLDDSCYYNYTDIKVGSTINVVGNDILIYDADDFTRNYLADNGCPLGERLNLVFEKPPQKIVADPPPHNGFGSEEDSLQTCSGSLMPKPPKKDGLKQKLYAGQMLRFRIKFRRPKAVDAEREFILQVFLEDDTIQIREIPNRNSGFAGGKFLSRSRQHHKDGKQILPGDITLGKTLYVQSHEFEVLDADEFSLKYMEQNADVWQDSSSESLAKTLRCHEESLREVLRGMEDRALQEMSYDELHDILSSVGVNLTTQEKLTLVRAMDPKRKGSVKFYRLFRIINDESMYDSWRSTSNSTLL
jgi:hypothetical protein